jgi:hypothetical protein
VDLLPRPLIFKFLQTSCRNLADSFRLSRRAYDREMPRLTQIPSMGDG